MTDQFDWRALAREYAEWQEGLRKLPPLFGALNYESDPPVPGGQGEVRPGLVHDTTGRYPGGGWGRFFDMVQVERQLLKAARRMSYQ